MKKMKRKVVLMAVLPWLSIPFIGRKTIKQFLPGAIFMALYVTAEGMLATRRRWWWFSFNTKQNVLGELPLILGPFFIGSLWILKYTYRRFGKYLLVNLIIDSFFTYYMVDWFKRIGYATLIRINKVQLSLIFMIKAFVMYGFQILFDLFRQRGADDQLS